MKNRYLSFGFGLIVLGTIFFLSCTKEKVIESPSVFVENTATTEETNSVTVFDYEQIRDEQLALLNEYINTNAISVDTTNSNALNSVGFDVYAKKDYVSAIRFFREAAYLNSESAFPHYNLACCLSLLLAQSNGNNNVIERYNLYPSNVVSQEQMMEDELYDNLGITFQLSKEHVEKSQSDSDLTFIRSQERFQELLAAYVPKELPQSLPSKYFTKEDYLDMILVEGGSMEIQGTEVTLDSFYMNRYELVTKIEGETDNWAIRNQKIDSTSTITEIWDWSQEEPVVSPLWFLDALIICNRLSLMEGFEPVYYIGEDDVFLYKDTYNNDNMYIRWEANGYRLPTEAEWEYAARGGQKSKGYIYAGSDNIDEVAWYDERVQGNQRDTPPAGKMPNELGLYDMSGNVSEWCIDAWTDPVVMEPSHNPNRINFLNWEITYENYLCVVKGGHIDSRGSGYKFWGDKNYFTPQSRIKGLRTVHLPELLGLSEGEKTAGIRLVRSNNE